VHRSWRGLAQQQRLPRKRRKLLPTANHLSATEKADQVPNDPGDKYCIFLQAEETELGHAHSVDRTEEAEGLLTLLAVGCLQQLQLLQPGKTY